MSVFFKRGIPFFLSLARHVVRPGGLLLGFLLKIRLNSAETKGKRHKLRTFGIENQ